MAKKVKKVRKPNHRFPMSHDKTVEVVNELGGILNTISLAMLNGVSDIGLKDLVVKKGSEAINPVVKKICLNLSRSDYISDDITELRSRLSEALL